MLQKCNGEAPDKSQLRMYDMIYYNPKTNPMKRHVEEEEKEGAAKERRMSLASEISLKQEVQKKEPDPVSRGEYPSPALILMNLFYRSRNRKRTP